MKTLALSEKTFRIIKELKEKENSKSFDELVMALIMKKEKVPKSMFGALKGRTKSFTKKERRALWKDSERDF